MPLGSSVLSPEILIRFMKKSRNVWRRGELTAHCADTKTMIKHINNKLVELGVPSDKIKSYHSDSTEDKDDLKDVNVSWDGYHISFSPSIVTGVDCTNGSRTVFLYVNCAGLTYGKSRTINARAMAQQVARFRNINKLVVYLESNSYDPGYTSKADFESKFLDHIDKTNEYVGPLLIKADDNGRCLNDTRFARLSIDYRYENEMIQADQENYLVERLTAKGFDISFSKEEKKKDKLECQHPDIDEYLEILARSGGKEPNTNLFQNIKDRVELLKLQTKYELDNLDSEHQGYPLLL